MRQIVSTIRYQMDAYKRTSKPAMPGFALVVLVALLYAVIPVYAADSYAVSATILCFISAWAALTYADVEDPVSQQILTLKLGGIARYQMACTLFLWLLGLIGALYATLLPLLVNALNGFRMYKEAPAASAIPMALLLHACAALAGTQTGALLHPRLIQDRRLAMFLLVAIMMIGFLKLGIHQVHGAFRAVTWLFPPVSEISEVLSGEANFPLGQSFAMMGKLFAYGVAAAVLRIGLLSRKRFA